MKRLFPILFLFALLLVDVPQAKASTFFIQQNAGVAFVPQVAFVPNNSVFLAGGGCNVGAFSGNTFFAGGRQAVFVNRGFGVGGQTTFVQSGGLLGRRNTFFQSGGVGGNTTLIQNRGLLGVNRSTFFSTGGGQTTFFKGR